MKNHHTNINLKKLRPYFMLDAWRGFASLWVMSLHVSAVIVAEYPSLAHTLFYSFCLQGALGVPLFFVISGYCIMSAAASNLNRDCNPQKYLRARLRRIYPPYWSALFFTFIITIIADFMVKRGYLHASLLVAHLHENKQKWFSFLITNITLTTPLLHEIPLIMPAWSLCYEIAFYLLVGVGLWVTINQKRNEETLLLGLHIVTTLSLTLLLCTSQVCFPFDLWPQFGLGILTYDQLRFPHRRRASVFLMLNGLSIIILSLLKPHQFVGSIGQVVFPQYLISLIFALTLIVLYSRDGYLSSRRFLRPLYSIGAFSYSLYITHVLSIGLMHQVLMKFHLPQTVHYLLFFGTSGGAVGFAYLFYLVCERPFISGQRQQMIKTLQHQPPLEPSFQQEDIVSGGIS